MQEGPRENPGMLCYVYIQNHDLSFELGWKVQNMYLCGFENICLMNGHCCKKIATPSMYLSAIPLSKH